MSEVTQLMHLLPMPVARFGEYGALEALNPAAETLFRELGFDGAAGLQPILDRLSPGLSECWLSAAAADCVDARRCTVTAPRGSARHVLLRLLRLQQRCTLMILDDVTTAVEQERELERHRRRLQRVLEHVSGYGVAFLDDDGTVVENPSLGRLLCMAAPAEVGWPLLHRVTVRLPGQASPLSFADVKSVIAGRGSCRADASWKGGGSQDLCGDCVIAPVVDAGGAGGGHLAVIRDVSIERAHTQELIDAALTDPLTGLLNRRGLEGRSEALHLRLGGRECTQVWIMADLDHFKHVNDSCGHEAGDLVLCAVADALRATARVGDLVARLGGEEFVVVLPDTSVELGARIAERLRLAIETQSTDAGGRMLRVTASFGVAQRQAQESPIQVLERADAALYGSKTGGRNRVTVC